MARKPIFQLASEPPSGGSAARDGKFAIMSRSVGATSTADFVRRMLEQVSDDTFLALVSASRESVTSKRLDSVRRMICNQIDLGKMNDECQAAIAEFVGFSLQGSEGRTWRVATAAEFEEMLEKKCGTKLAPRVVGRDQPLQLVGRRDVQSWSLIENLCSISLFGGQYEGTDLDFELSGQFEHITITDESNRIILQRAVVVRRCVIELDLGGAEVIGGLTALRNAVLKYLQRENTDHLVITVGGSARKPHLTVEVKLEAIVAIGIVRPLQSADPNLIDELASVCWLTGVAPNSTVTAEVRIFDSDLQDRPSSDVALEVTDDDLNGPAVAAKSDRPLSADHRARILMHMWKLAQRSGQNAEPGALTLAYDARSYRDPNQNDKS